MRVLLDENIPVDLSAELSPHAVDTVAGLGWAGIKNGELLRRMSGQYDALVTMDQNIEFQQVVSRQTFGVVVLLAISNRLSALRPLIPDLIQALDELRPGELRKIGS